MLEIQVNACLVSHALCFNANEMEEKEFSIWQNTFIHSRFVTDEYSDESEDVEEDIRGHDDGGHGNGHGHGHGHIKKKKRKKHKKKFKVRRKYKKFLMPLLIAYKLKFFALIPVFIGKMFLYIKLKLLQYITGSVLYFLTQIGNSLHSKRRKKIGKRRRRPPYRLVVRKKTRVYKRSQLAKL